jgi:hypothetical protein
MTANNSLTIQSPRPPGIWLVLAFILFWFVLWCLHGGGMQSVLVGLAFGGCIFTWGVEHAYTTFLIQLTPESVCLKQQTPFRSRAWTCPIQGIRRM